MNTFLLIMDVAFLLGAGILIWLALVGSLSLNTFLFIMDVAFLLLAGILIGSSFGGFLGSWCVILTAVFVIVSWGTVAAVTVNILRLAFVASDGDSTTQASKLANGLFITVAALSPITGVIFAFGALVGCGPLWLPTIYQWCGVGGTIAGFVGIFLLPVVSGTTPYRWWWVVSMPLLVGVLWGLAWFIPYLILKGDINLSDYKAQSHIQYFLPFPGGESSWVIQGNNSSLDHNNDHLGQKFSWDFRRECGTPVLAARPGSIPISSTLLPDDTHDGFGTSATNNQIIVDHGDGTLAYYLHIQKGSVPTRFRTPGAKVNKGDEIAEVGCVGISLTGHIHFMVRPIGAVCTGNPATSTNCTTIGVSFTDVSDDNGIPRTFGSYTSGNRKVP